ncbi:MAG TPA: aminotransferase class I/II-fold pyridoxal phosphate-dependent enzyme [Candidatus Binatia bacterium]
MTARSGITGRSADAIARSVEHALETGRLSERDLLPPVRALAASLEVSPTTVAAAYRTLRQRGVVVGDGRRGTRIARREAEGPRLRIPVIDGAVHLADGNPDPALLPDLEPLLRRVPMPRDLYGEACMIPELADAARRLLAADRVEIPALTVVSGAMDGIERVLLTQLRPGDRVAVEDPAFAGVLDLLAAMALVAVPFMLDGEGPVPASFESAIASGVQAVIVTPRAQNPTGAATSPARGVELRKILDRHPSVLLVEDDHAAGVAGAPLVSLQSRKRVRHAYLRSMAKALGPDVRVAFLAGSVDVVARVEARQIVGMRWVSRLLQRLVVAALKDKKVLAAVAHAEAEYTRRRRAVIEALAARGVRATGASGMNVWIPVREEAVALQTIAVAGWTLAPGERFRVKSPPGLRVSISRLAVADTSRFADAVASALVPRRAATST